ncbi:N-6 DNA methylase [candidate division KSB3 bacterium]|uniref:site-specific DNA-methyltransferase (adenine-specific) n=1 Tax=candidate division KSB3 bacterium TaxID=2044937 RepID=A0A9D5JVK8_9BACT|nr:N-6 DNA methylase [candidate division KSB3 bacterium]MBD3325073.1 N-6 DNA methylase [candidate division KSB3 bacterium]
MSRWMIFTSICHEAFTSMSTQFHHICLTYLRQLREARNNLLATEELSLRPALDALLKQTASLLNMPIQIVSEAKQVKAGRPDFTITTNDLPLGYIEAEAYNVNLDALSGHAREQNDRFRDNLDNFLLTNHLEFRLYVGGTLVLRARLPEPPEKGTISITRDETDALAELLEDFLQGQFPAIASSKDLAIHLARRTRQIRTEVLHVLTDSSSPSEMHEQYEAFKEVLLPDLSQEQFAGLYAQTITYGLFAARCMASSGTKFTRLSAAALVPKTNPFLRKLFQRIAAYDLDDRVAWIADDTAQLLEKAPMSDILADFGTRTGREDPVVHFYETFLAAYDSKVREVRGVYYTPEPVVSYIVRSLDHLLKTRFHKPMGLADEHTLILDPATGTGSFLFAIVRHVYETVCRTYGVGAWNEYVSGKLLPRLFGFELLIAPYAVAHLKLGVQLQDLSYTFNSDQRLGIYLTNTLEEAIKKSDLLLGKFISEEADEAAAIKKERPILVVLGNPPYSISTQNKGQWITQLLKIYKQDLNEKKHNIDDDYVKFIRFAQWRIEQTGEGIIGYITNNGYLDSPTFRVMRQSLLHSFNEIYIYNLHGNSRKREKTPDGKKDENVFDIRQGVSILLCVKQKGNLKPAQVYYADLWGKRNVKYGILSERDLNKTKWKKIKLKRPLYLFVHKEAQYLDEYETGWSVSKIFHNFGSGLNTDRDALCIDFDRDLLIQRMKIFFSGEYNENFRKKYRLYPSSSYNPEERRKIMTFSEECVRKCLYRPFDTRNIYYQIGFTSRPMFDVMKHMFFNNLGMVITRQTKEPFAALCSSNICTHKIVAIYDRSSLFPLYLYPDETTGQTTIDTERRPNFNPQFLNALAAKLGLPQTPPHGLPQGITPEDIFHYTYAAFHSPTYRERYADFLKIDFPRLPLTSDLDLFQDLAALGKQLVALHLLDTAAAPMLAVPTSPFPVSGSNTVESVTYDATEQRVSINKTQYFENVPTDVWEFRVGGYQVCHKWLKDRKGRQLTFEDIQHYQRIVIALAETLNLMNAIDERIPEFPLP